MAHQPKSKLILWDIDGTLIRGSRRGVELFNAALSRVYGLQPPIKRINYGGKTDGQIVHETLALYDWHHDAINQHWELFQTEYIRSVREIEHLLADDIRVIDGVVPALARLGDQAIHALLTGNLRETARIKLDAVRLSRWFTWEWSAFGSDHVDRLRLVPFALERAWAGGWHGTRDDVVIIGDTPNDIACARAGGVKVIAVATGRVSYEELAQHEPDVVVHTLDEVENLSIPRLA